MWFDKKIRPTAEPTPVTPAPHPPSPPEVKTPMTEPTTKSTSVSAAAIPNTVIGRTVKMQGQLSAGEDLFIDGQFEGTINLRDHCLTIGKEGEVKSEVH